MLKCTIWSKRKLQEGNESTNVGLQDTFWSESNHVLPSCRCSSLEASQIITCQNELDPLQSSITATTTITVRFNVYLVSCSIKQWPLITVLLTLGNLSENFVCLFVLRKCLILLSRKKHSTISLLWWYNDLEQNKIPLFYSNFHFLSSKVRRKFH